MDGLEDDTFDPDDTHHSVQSLSGHGCRPFARLSLSPPGQRCAVTPRIRRWQWRDARMESRSSLSMEWPLLGRQSIEMILAFSYIKRVGSDLPGDDVTARRREAAGSAAGRQERSTARVKAKEFFSSRRAIDHPPGWRNVPQPTGVPTGYVMWDEMSV